jgi:rhodanese-related sulfurtransferase
MGGVRLAAATFTPVDAELSPDALPDGATLVDVRRDDEWAEGHIPGARHVRFEALQAAADELPDPVVFYCKSGDRSLVAAQAFRASGREAASLAGGIDAWTAAGRPVDA